MNFRISPKDFSLCILQRRVLSEALIRSMKEDARRIEKLKRADIVEDAKQNLAASCDLYVSLSEDKEQAREFTSQYYGPLALS